MDEIDALVQRMNAEPGLVKGMVLVGHADRLNSTGQKDYNVRLAESGCRRCVACCCSAACPPA